MEELVNTVPTVGPNNAAVLALCVLLDDISIFTEQCAWLDDLDGLLQALSRRFRYAHGVRVCQGLVANVECLVQIRVETTVIDRNVNVQDIAVFEYSLVRDAVADDLV
jgi:hypothetical protein